MEKTAFLVGRKVYLRPFEKDDANHFYKFVNDEKVNKYLTSGSYPNSILEENNFVETVMSGQRKLTNHLFTVVRKSDNTVLGSIGLHKASPIHRTCEVGIMLGRTDLRNKGYATDAAMLILRYAFMRLNLRRSFWKAFSENLASIKVAEKCAFKNEAIIKEVFYCDGRYLNEVILSLDKGTYLKKQELYFGIPSKRKQSSSLK